MNWLDSYYEALQFYYWEPQHIGRKKYADAKFNTITKVADHLRTIEAPLNHNLNQFFLLAPDSLRNELFKEIFGREFQAAFVMHGGGVEVEFGLTNSVQPDFFFLSEIELVCIEMKVGSKCSVSQVLKYALLGLAVEIRQERPKEHYLALLGSGKFTSQFRKHFESPDQLKLELADADLTAFLGTQPIHLSQHQDRFNQIVKQLHLGFLTYGDFAHFLRSAIPSTSDQSPGAEVYRKLISGLLDELRRRKLS